MEVVNKQLSPESKLNIDVVGGNIVLKIGLDMAGVKGNSELVVDSDYFIDQLAAKIPGTLDDNIFAVLKSVLKSL